MEEQLAATPYRCPACRQRLALVELAGGLGCERCGWRAGESDGVLDFVSGEAKRGEIDFYEAEYSGPVRLVPTSPAALAQLWRDNPYAPQNAILWDRLEGMAGKVVVVLGSGAAPRELALLERSPAALVISDLSKAAMRRLQASHRSGDGRVRFAAIDAEDLPFADSSVDVLYGYLFAHHLPDLDRFLAEAARVLAPGGRAVFLDTAYSGPWQRAKQSWLRWLMDISHRVNHVSPEDMRYTLQGGFRPADLGRRIRAVGGEPWFHRSGLIHYLGIRSSEIAQHAWPPLGLSARTWTPDAGAPGGYRLRWRHERVLRLLQRADEALVARFPSCSALAIRLVWGFDMPG